jgi:predicted methyltransferase
MELLRRIGDTREGYVADVYEVVVTGNRPASDVNDALVRLVRRGLVQAHEGGWVLTERGRVAVGATDRPTSDR